MVSTRDYLDFAIGTAFQAGRSFLPILEEAGGTFTDWSGSATIYGGSAISTNGLVSPEIEELLA